jgi:cysteinyl-tRNA synthetase
MSKSLKNFITIRDVLKKYSGRTVRFLFLLTPWDQTMSFSDDSLKAAATKEKEFLEFFANTKISIRAKSQIDKNPQLWNDADRNLHSKLISTREAVHAAFCDNFDYPRAMALISELISDTNKYRLDPEYKTVLLAQIARWIDSMIRVFGVVPDPEPSLDGGSGAGNSRLEGVLDAVTAFRDAIRDAARNKKSPAELLALCDQFRDGAMLELGVRLEDVAAQPGSASAAPAAPAAFKSVWKLDDPEKLIRERAEKRLAETANKLSKAVNKLEKLRKDSEKLKDSAVSPKDFFAGMKDKYSQFDEAGKPTHDNEGKELAKSAAKTLAKTWESREKAHKDYQSKLEKNPKLLDEMAAEEAQLQDEVNKLKQQVQEQEAGEQ